MTATPPSTIAQLQQYYSDLLAYEYRGQVNARAQIALFVEQGFADLVLLLIANAFQIDTAVGPQLDVIGKYIGLSRNIGPGTPPGFFSTWDYASTLDLTKYQGTWDPTTDGPMIPAAGSGNNGWWYVASAAGTSTLPIAATFSCGDVILSNGTVWAKETTDNGNGLTDYLDPAVNANGVFYDYAMADMQTSDLTDSSYRTVLKLKAILNSSPGTAYAIVAALQAAFPGQITLKDNHDMTLSYTVLSTVPLSQSLLEQFLPAPMGVGITVTIISPIPGAGDEIESEDLSSIITSESGDPIISEGS